MYISLDVLPYKKQSHKKDTAFMSVARKPARSLILMSTRAIKTAKIWQTFRFYRTSSSNKANSTRTIVAKGSKNDQYKPYSCLFSRV